MYFIGWVKRTFLAKGLLVKFKKWNDAFKSVVTVLLTFEKYKYPASRVKPI